MILMGWRRGGGVSACGEGGVIPKSHVLLKKSQKSSCNTDFYI